MGSTSIPLQIRFVFGAQAAPPPVQKGLILSGVRTSVTCGRGETTRGNIFFLPLLVLVACTSLAMTVNLS